MPTQTGEAFLAPRAAPRLLRNSGATSFGLVNIKFVPRAEEVSLQEMSCENDFAVCNRECERLYGERTAELEEPCKLAVASQFGGGGAVCFPGCSTVHERRRGVIRLADAVVGDEIATQGGAFSRIVASLHDSPSAVALYLRIRHAGGTVAASPQHLLRARRRGAPPRGESGLNSPGLPSAAPPAGPPAGVWSWAPAQDLRAGDELEDASGAPVTVQSVSRVCLAGAFAPLTLTGTLLVDGVLCSCYGPPASWSVPHAACHAAMLPLRLLDAAREMVERWSCPRGSKDPVLTLEALWLLPTGDDVTMHPYASGLLRAASLAQGASRRCGVALPPSLGGLLCAIKGPPAAAAPSGAAAPPAVAAG